MLLLYNIIYCFGYMPILLNIKHIREHICAITILATIFGIKALLPGVPAMIINYGMILFAIPSFLFASFLLFAVVYNTVRKRITRQNKSYYNRQRTMIGAKKLVILRHSFRFYAMSMVSMGIFYY